MILLLILAIGTITVFCCSLLFVSLPGSTHVRGANARAGEASALRETPLWTTMSTLRIGVAVTHEFLNSLGALQHPPFIRSRATGPGTGHAWDVCMVRVEQTTRAKGASGARARKATVHRQVPHAVSDILFIVYIYIYIYTTNVYIILYVIYTIYRYI